MGLEAPAIGQGFSRPQSGADREDGGLAGCPSVARMRAENAWLSNPQYWALQEKTLNLGLRRAGFPDH
jgi:hypothetical protein